MNLEARIKRRLLMEHPELDHESTNWEGLPDWTFAEADMQPPTTAAAARIAALEAEDTANPIAATAVVRRPLNLTVDVEAVAAKFAMVRTDAELDAVIAKFPQEEA